MNSQLEQTIQFADNPEPRCPCVLLVDTSTSMGGAPISELNEGLQKLKMSLEQDPLASKRVEIAVVSFNSRVVVEQSFVTSDTFSPPTLTATGSTSMGAGVVTALDLVETRKSEYRTNGVSYFRPWIFLITDGEPTDDTSLAATRVRDAEARHLAAFFAVGVREANLSKLALISVRPPLKLDGLNFSELFIWLSRSLQNIAVSRPGEQVALPPVGWSVV